MIFKLLITQKQPQAKEISKTKDILYPIYYMIMGFIFGGVLLLSALNNFLFFGHLAISMLIIFGLMTIHLLGEQQTKRYKF